MKKRRSLTRQEQVTTLRGFMARKRWTQRELVRFLDENGVIISAQYLNDVLNNRRAPGQKFKQVLSELTGIRFVDALVEEDR